MVRHAWHGGFFAPLTGDRFRRPTRAPIEYANSFALQAMGIPTTTVLGFARYDAGLGSCRVDVLSRFVPDAFDLGMVAAALVPEIATAEALDATAQLLYKMAVAGVVHPDLNVKNVLLARPESLMTPPALVAMIIDVDVVRWTTNVPAHEVMQRNLNRLVRSARKWRTQFGCDLTDRTLDAFVRDTVGTIAPLRAS